MFCLRFRLDLGRSFALLFCLYIVYVLLLVYVVQLNDYIFASIYDTLFLFINSVQMLLLYFIIFFNLNKHTYTFLNYFM